MKRKSTFRVGDKVRIDRYVRVLVYRLSHWTQGAWLIDRPIDGFRQWNESEMKPYKPRIVSGGTR